MMKIDEKLSSELGVAEEQLKEGLDLGVREPLNAKELEDMRLEQMDEEAGPLYRVRHNVELIENKMLRKIQNHLSETKYQIPSILQEMGHDKDYQIALKRRNMQVFDEQAYHKVSENNEMTAMHLLELEEHIQDEQAQKQAWMAQSFEERNNYMKMVITGDEIKEVYKQ